MKKILAIAAAMLLGLAGARAGQPATQASAATSAHRVLRIENTDAYFDVVRDFEANHLKDFRFDSISSNQPDEVDVEQNVEGDSPLIDIYVDTRNTGQWAQQAADLVVSQLQSRLAILVQQQRAARKLQTQAEYQKVQSLEQRRIAIEGRLKLVDGDVSELIDSIGLPDLSPLSLDTLVQSLAAQFETVQIDIAGKSARKDALSNAVATLSKQLNERVGSDEIVEQLQEVVKARQQEVDAEKARYKEAISPALELNQAMAALAEAKAKVMEREEEVAHAAGGDEMQQWNQDLLLLSVDLADLHAQSNALHKRLDVLGQYAGTLGVKQKARDSLEMALNKIEDELNDVAFSRAGEPAFNAPQPKLTVIESQ